MNGVFTISLDFELHWGGFEKWPLRIKDEGMHYQEKIVQDKHGAPDSLNDQAKAIRDLKGYNEYFLTTREVIPEMLSLFEKYQAHVTWATVGMLFHQNKKELLQNAPAQKPSYRESILSAYHFIDSTGIGENEETDPFHFAQSLISKIIETPFQELGTHTFAHYYCNEAGQTVDQFRDDIRAAQRAAAKFGKQLKSLVFPRNQFNDQYLKVCFEEGITSVRSNPLDWFWHIESTQKESAWKRLSRGLDAYFPVGKKNTYPLSSIPVLDQLPLSLPASRLLRPYHPREFVLNDLKINRIKSEMSRAAKNNEVYHLWWHPHNFGHYPGQSMQALKQILDHFSLCRNLYGMNSLTMSETADLILQQHAKTKTA